MMKRLLSGAALIAACVTACSRQPKVPVEVKDLAFAARRARYSESCAKRVVLERSVSFPVPVARGVGVRFRILYYGLTPRRAGAPRQLYPPAIVAEFDPAAGDSACTELVSAVSVEPGQTLGPSLGPAAAALSLEQYKRNEAELYSALERASSAYFSERDDAAARASAAKFLDLFDELSEPGLKQFYEELNPSFWRWARDAAGRGR